MTPARRRAQQGSTLVELLVSVGLIGVALVLMVGAFSSGVIGGATAKRSAGVQAAFAYEMDSIRATAYSATPAAYSDCFTIEGATPSVGAASAGVCPAGTSLRADVVPGSGPLPNLQLWTVTVVPLLGGGPTVSRSVYKDNR